MQQDNAKGSTALQAGVVNVYNGIQEEQLDKKIEKKTKAMALPLQRQISVIQEEMLSLQHNLIEKTGVAEQKQTSRCNILGKNFILKLLDESDDKKEKIFKAFEEPSMQESFCKAQHGYAMSGEEDHLNILTDMLIDRGNISQRNNRQMLIDEAIDTLPRLNQKHLNILIFYAEISLVENNYDKVIVNNHIQNLIEYLNKIIPLQDNDSNLLYLEQKKCLNGLSIGSLKEINKILEERIEIFHSGFPKEEYNKLITVDISEIPFEKSLTKPENVVINTSLENLKNILNKNSVDKKNYDEIIRFWNRNRGDNDHILIKNYIINNFEKGNLLFEYWDYIKGYNLTLLGIMLALVYLKTKYQRDINWNFE